MMTDQDSNLCTPVKEIEALKVALNQWFSTGGGADTLPGGGARVGYRMGEKKKRKIKSANFFYH